MTRPAMLRPAAWRRLAGTGIAAALGVGLIAACTVFASVAMPRQSAALRTSALHAELGALPPLSRSVLATSSYADYLTATGLHSAAASQFATVRATIRRNLVSERLPLSPAVADWSGLASAYAQVSGAGRRAYSGSTGPPRLEVLYRDALSRNAALVAGRWPGAAMTGPHGTVFGVGVTQATAARYGLGVGSQLSAAGGLRLQVTGIVRPVRQRSVFWTEDPAALRPAQFAAPGLNGASYWTGAVFAGQDELPPLISLMHTGLRLYWVYPLDVRQVTAAQAPALQSALGQASLRGGLIGTGPGGAQAIVNVLIGIFGPLAAFISTDQTAGGLLSLLFISLAVIYGVVLLLGIALLSQHRAAEFGLLRARGAARWQLAVVALRRGMAVALPAAVAGAAVAAYLTPGPGAPVGWWLAGAITLLALAGPAWLAARTSGTGGPDGRRAAGPRRKAAIRRRWVVDAALVCASAGGLVVLRQQGVQPAGQTDLLTSAAPVLAAIPAAVLVLRIYPIALRRLLNRARTWRGVTALVGLARGADQSPALSAFALVLALALVTFGAMTRSAVQHGQVLASWQQAGGADAVVDASGTGLPIIGATQRAIREVPGATGTLAVGLDTGQLPDGGTLNVIAVDPVRYAALIARTSLPAFPAGLLASAAGSTTVAALASRSAAAGLGQGTHSVSVGTRDIRFRVTGIIGGIPGVQAGNSFVVIPRRAEAGALPHLMLVTGQHVSGTALAAVVRRAIPNAIITMRAVVFAARTGDPVAHSAFVSFSEGAAAAAGFSVLVLLTMLLLGARSRALTLARLAALGLSPGQARRVGITETAPAVLAAIGGGIVSAVALGPLVGPSMNLSSLTGSATPVPIRPDLTALAVTAAGLAILTVLTLAGQVIVSGRREPGRALRLDE